MKPVLLDTSIWIRWLRGSLKDLREEARGRTLLMPSVVALELLAGARDLRRMRDIDRLIDGFDRNRRLITPSSEDFQVAGRLLASLRKGASLHTNDMLITLMTRKAGGELWTSNARDFAPFCEEAKVPLRSVSNS